MNNNFLPYQLKKNAEQNSVLASQLAQSATQLQDIAYDPRNPKYGAKCDGVTDDTNAFQSALNDAAANGGGLVLIPVGTSIVSGLTIASYCGLIGRGRKSILKQKANSTGAVVSLANQNVQFIHLSDFTIDGNKANQTNSACKGIYFNGTTSYISNSTFNDGDARHVIKNIYIMNTYGIGFDMNGRGECHVHNVQVFACNDVGMNLNAFDMWYSNLSSGANKKTGIVISQNNIRLVNCKSWNNGYNDATDGYGFKITATDIEGIILTACEAQANYNHGFAFFNARGCIGSGLNSELNGSVVNSFGTNNLAGVGGFYFNASRENNIQGVCRNMNSAIQEYAVIIDGYTVNNKIDVTAWYMKTGAVNDISSNKDNNTLSIINVTTGEVVSNYRNQSIDLLRVNGAPNALSGSPFGVYAIDTKSSYNALLQKEVSSITTMQEILRLEAFQTGNYNTHSRVQIRTQVNNGAVDFATQGTSISLNGNNLAVVKSGTAAPTSNADYIGQIFVDYTNKIGYMAVQTGTGSTDWKQITN